MDKKNICVVGAGNWGKNHIATLIQLGCLGGIVDTNENQLNIFKEKYSYIKTYNNVKDSLEDNYNGYVVATNAQTHYEIASILLENTQHVLVEKPITLNSDDAIKLHELAIDKNVNLMVGHVLLFHPAFQKIKSLLDDGTLGQLQYMYSNRLNLGTIRTEENVFWSFAPHDIALYQYFTNSFPKKITSRGSDVLQDGVHDTTITTFEYPNHVMGHIFVSWLHPFKEHRFVIVGSKGMIRFEDSIEGKPLVLYDKSIDWKDGKPIPRSGSTRHIEYDDNMPLTAELQYFIDHLNGNPITINNSESAIEVIKILELATKSLVEN
ncbi:Gfo/Idh/MocA family oxidoreductase [bacterium]|nr:Gfo/Idh/MocA family oxidoreductase [bacterium]